MDRRSTLFGSSSLALTAPFLVCLPACGAPPGDDEETADASAELVVCADGDVLEGIDVSYYQGQVDWSEVAASGRSFAIARINHGTFMDPEFEANWNGMREAGLIRGAYQYFEPGEDVIYQAEVAIDYVGELGPGDLPVTIDVEATTGLDPVAVAASVQEWVELVEEGTGRRPIIYTGKYFWNDNVQTDAFADWPLWIAAYGPPCPDTPEAWDDWSFWQYSSTGTVPGIAGDVDLDVFKGGVAELETLAGIVYRAEVISIDAPSKMAAGTEATVRIEVDNTGGREWNDETRLGTTEPRDRASDFATSEWIEDNRPAGVAMSVAPGDAYVFEFTIVAPAEPGDYVEHFGLVQEGSTWFADEPGGGPPDDEIQLAIEVTAAPEAPGPAGDGQAPPAAAPEDDSGCRVSRAGRVAGGEGRWVWALLVAGLLRRGHRRGPAVNSKSRVCA